MWKEFHLSSSVKKIWGNRIIIFLFVLNLITNSTILFYPIYNSFSFICKAITVSALFSTVESILFKLFKKVYLHYVFIIVIVFFHIILFIVDIFLFKNFNYLLGQESIEILAQTTFAEARSFLTAYVSVPYIILSILFILCAIWLFNKTALILSGRTSTSIVLFVLTVAGLIVYMVSIWNFVSFGKGQFVPQLHSFTRSVYSSKVLFDRHSQIVELRRINAQVKASKSSDYVNTIIVVIGESFSAYHSSLYGYSKETNPLLAKRAANGSLTVFTDVVSFSDHTEEVMCTIFPLNKQPEKFFMDPLFPTCFKVSGYHTTLLDNQYFVGNRIMFLSDKELSSIMFDYRNTKGYDYDGEMLQDVRLIDSPQLIVLHLQGQHFIYSDRYPKRFTRFEPKDYSNLSEKQKAIVAHYDNATMYNDYVIDQIIRLVEDRDCLVVYFPDHGQDVYEVDDFMGHGCASSRADLTYQVKVPLFIWTSDLFSTKHADKVKRIKESADKPIITSDLPHFLLDVAGVNTESLNSDQSFINDLYKTKNRIILNHIDYDSIKTLPRIKARYK